MTRLYMGSHDQAVYGIPGQAFPTTKLLHLLAITLHWTGEGEV